MGIDLVAEMVLAGGYPVAWYAPIYKLLSEVWREINSRLADYITKRNVQERRLEFVTGGTLDMWTLDNVFAGRGRKYARVVIDEASLVPDLWDAWNASIRPTLTDYRGDAWIFSTPRGRNGFWRLWQRGKAHMDWSAWQFATRTNPYIRADEIEAMRNSLPARFFQQEIEAAFLEDAGGVFRNVTECTTARPQDEPADGHDYAFGVDWGKHNDYTVISVIDLTTSELVYMDRFNQIDYTFQVGRLQALAERFDPVTIVAERNAMGEPLVEQLQRDGLPVQPFTTTNASKSQAIEALALAFERAEIGVIADDVLVSELQAYESQRLPSGLLRYNAPAGLHDDCVMSLALAWQAVDTGGSLFLW